MEYLTVYITTKDFREAKKLSRLLLEKRLIACANIIPSIESSYWWKGKIESHAESLLIGKTRKGLEGKIMALVKKHHSYSVPCVNFLPILKGNPDYLAWLGRETGKKKA